MFLRGRHPMTDDSHIDELYAAPLDEFVARRNQLVRSAKTTGDVDAADDLKALKKPSVSAWVVNQLAHRHGTAMQALVDAGSQMEEIQRTALSGEQVDFEAPKRAESDAIAELRLAAEEVMPAITATTLERVTNSLLAGARWSGGRDALLDGHLSTDLDPRGFDAYAGFEVRAQSEQAPKKRKNKRTRPTRSPVDGAHVDPVAAEIEALLEKRTIASETARAAAHESKKVEQEAEAARRTADRLAEQASVMRTRADDAAAALQQLETRLDHLTGDDRP